MSGTFLQSNLWTLFKGSFGWEPYSFHYEGKLVNVLLRHFGKFFSLAYIPYAPIEQDKLEEISAYLKTLLPKGCVFIRYDLPWYVAQEGEWPDAPKSFHKAIMDIPPAGRNPERDQGQGTTQHKDSRKERGCHLLPWRRETPSMV